MEHARTLTGLFWIMTQAQRLRGLARYAGVLGVRAVEIVGKFGLYVLAARRMGGYDAGLFFLCLTWVNFCSTAARLGLERAMSRHIAAELAIGRGLAARRALLLGLGGTMLGSLTALAVTVALSSPVARLVFHQPDLAAALRTASLILPFQTVAFAVGFALIGLNRGVFAQVVQGALPTLLPLAALLASLTDLHVILLAYACSYAVCCVLGIGVLAHDWRTRMVERNVSLDTAPEALPTLWATARPFLVIELIQVSLLSLPVLLLGAFGSVVSVAQFSIVSRLTMLINTLLVSFALIAAPGFARDHRRREYAELRRAERRTRLIGMAVCLPAIAIMVAAPGPLLKLLGGFSGASPALLVLALGQVVNTFLPTQDMMLSMTGHGALLRRLNLLQLSTCVVAGLIIIPSFDLMGAAIVSTLCLVQGRVTFALAVRQALPELKASRA